MNATRKPGDPVGGLLAGQAATGPSPSPSPDPAAADADADHRLVIEAAERLFAQPQPQLLHARAEAGELDAGLWQQLSDAGFPLLLAGEADGGFGGTWATACQVLVAQARVQLPVPLAETLVAAQLLSAAGLPVPAGSLTVIEASQTAGLQLAQEGAHTVLSGVVHQVPWARHARAAVVSLPGGLLGLLPLHDQAGVVAPGLRCEPWANHAGLPSDSLHLQPTRLVAVAPHGLGLDQPVWTLGALARCAQLVGALEAVLAQSVQYAGERVQFGQAIGKYQAVQQQLALLAGDVVAARVATEVAAAAAPWAGALAPADPADRGAAARAWAYHTAVAKVRCGEAAGRAAAIAHQVHGAIGFTQVHALHRATRRLWAWREEFGSDAQWAVALGQAAITAGARGFWPAFTAGQLWPASG